MRKSSTAFNAPRQSSRRVPVVGYDGRIINIDTVAQTHAIVNSKAHQLNANPLLQSLLDRSEVCRYAVTHVLSEPAGHHAVPTVAGLPIRAPGKSTLLGRITKALRRATGRGN